MQLWVLISKFYEEIRSTHLKLRFSRNVCYPKVNSRLSLKTRKWTVYVDKLLYLPQEPFIGVVALNFAKHRRQREETTPSRLATVDSIQNQ